MKIKYKKNCSSSQQFNIIILVREKSMNFSHTFLPWRYIEFTVEIENIEDLYN